MWIFAKKLLVLTLIVTGFVLGGSASVFAQTNEKIKVGVMLPFSGVYAELGNQIFNAFKLHVAEQGGRLAGREIEYVVLDDEADPSKSVENAMKLVKRDKVDVLFGTVHSGVQLGLTKVARETGTLLLIPNAGTNELTGQLCAPNIFRVSFSNWQQGYATGTAAAAAQLKKVVSITWDYTAGKQFVAGFKEAFEKSGGQVIKEMYLPFPNTEFQAYLTEIASLKPDAIYSFFAGAGATKFIRDYAQSGLKNSLSFFGTAFPEKPFAEGIAKDAQGMFSTMTYGDDLDIEKDKSYREAFMKAYHEEPSGFSVYGYDAAQLLRIGLTAVNGDMSRKEEMIKAMEKAEIDSPRGKFRLSKAHNPIQTFYLRRVEGEKNKVIGIAVKDLEDPAIGCKM